MASIPVMTEAALMSTYGPTHVELPVISAKPLATNGTVTTVEQTASFRCRYRNFAAVGDYEEYGVTLAPGSHSLAIEGWQGASLGRVGVSIDGVQIGVLDQWISGTTQASRVTFPGITIRTGGRHVVRLTVLTKNSGSAGSAVRVSHISFTRTSATAVPDLFAWTYLAASFTPRSIGVDGSVYGNGGTGDRVLMRSADGGKTFETGQDFGTLVVAGEYLQFVGRTTDGYVVVTSTDASVAGNSGRIWFSTSFASGFTAVQNIKGTNEFSTSKPEIGPNGHTWLAVGEYSTDLPQPVHNLWHSSDGGQTWRNIRSAQVVDNTKNSHFHGCAHDPNNDMRLYSSQGDNTNSRFSYTDNPEAATPTWVDINMSSTHALYSETGAQQPTTVGCFPGLLFASPDRIVAGGMWTMSSASDSTLADPSSVWQTTDGESAQNMFGRSPYAQADTRAVVNVPDRFTGTNKAHFIATGDSGRTWHIIHTMALTSPGSGSLGVVGPDKNGLIFYRSLSNPNPAGSNLMVAPMPTFRSIP